MSDSIPENHPAYRDRMGDLSSRSEHEQARSVKLLRAARGLPPEDPKQSLDGIDKTQGLLGKLGAAPTKALDVQVGGAHYKSCTIQPVEFSYRNGLNFMEGSVVKYICRHRSKNGVEDLKKAKHYIDLLIELEYAEPAKKATYCNHAQLGYDDIDTKAADERRQSSGPSDEHDGAPCCGEQG